MIPLSEMTVAEEEGDETSSALWAKTKTRKDEEKRKAVASASARLKKLFDIAVRI